ncbi:hypothetical protein NL329_19580 [Klebsiella pneumoniae]|uniref:hypothetical protein n=1 Tax=Klebsiella pneumoniae TaxID=573 RepID=UPI00109177D8|nr:hypothetical protein [Klebsiella pneumoniae]HDS7551007.1 hypothetical protein [Klebsiella pneumoniae subsp. ozaenae]HDT0390911.1 hypothetical protein [Klebsiella pneumoniae subsp. pneumoniae]MBS2850886.1 hypothetical protein [Klebsiella pneumoniae]MCP5785188.1 hypothetical protein [Klebsiella pneumoniae]MCP5836189.1 hypothetical protein [Klebsiella pneumoniae]
MASLSLANWALWRALNWYNRDAIFYFPPDFAVFVIFIVSCSGATRLFLDVSCYFNMVTNRRRYASRQAAFMIAKASSPLG